MPEEPIAPSGSMSVAPARATRPTPICKNRPNLLGPVLAWPGSPPARYMLFINGQEVLRPICSQPRRLRTISFDPRCSSSPAECAGDLRQVLWYAEVLLMPAVPNMTLGRRAWSSKRTGRRAGCRDATWKANGRCLAMKDRESSPIAVAFQSNCSRAPPRTAGKHSLLRALGRPTIPPYIGGFCPHPAAHRPVRPALPRPIIPGVR